jgi:hypothetical protein
MKLVTLLLTFALFASILQSAPLPKPPEKITTEFLNDTTWNYHYSTAKGGKITFRKDGTYDAYHDVNSDARFVGTWYVNKLGVICLNEFNFDTKKQVVNNVGCNFYMFITTKNFPTLTGTMSSCEEGRNSTFLELSKRIKFNAEE